MRTESHGKPSKVKRKSSWWRKHLFATSTLLELLCRTCHLFCFVSGLKVCAKVQPHTNDEAISMLNCKLPAAIQQVKDSNTSPVFYVSTCHTFNKTRRTFENNFITKTMFCLLNKGKTFGCVWSVSAMVTRYVDSGQGRPQGSYWEPCVLSQPGYGRDVEKTQRAPQLSCSPRIWTLWVGFFHGFLSFCSVVVLNAQRQGAWPAVDIPASIALRRHLVLGG